MISTLKSRLFTRPRSVGSPPAAPPPLSFATLEPQFPDAHRSHLETIVATQTTTMTSPERILALCEAVTFIVKNDIPGALVECGVWRGGSSAAAARTLLQLDAADRPLWLYDTFTGMTEPTDNDLDFMGRDAESLMQQSDPSDPQSVWCHSELDEVKTTMAATGYPDHQIHYVPGRVEETLKTESPKQIALLRLDTDWYESTRVEMEILFPRLVPGGILIIDDYGHWNGCRKAIDEYFDRHQITMFLNRIDYTGRLGVK